MMAGATVTRRRRRAASAAAASAGSEVDRLPARASESGSTFKSNSELAGPAPESLTVTGTEVAASGTAAARSPGPAGRPGASCAATRMILFQIAQLVRRARLSARRGAQNSGITAGRARPSESLTRPRSESPGTPG